MLPSDVHKAFGNLDIYLLDQILKNRFAEAQNLLDAGCGEGRNLKYFVDNGVDVYGNDLDPMAIKMAEMTYKSVPKGHFAVTSIEDLSYPPASFDIILCAAVLHFARDQKHFDSMLEKLVSTLKPNGILFIRMATDIGLETTIDSPFSFHLPKDSIGTTFSSRGLHFVEPWKSVVVESKRSMGTFILSKS